jgi:phosphoribosylformimino-5-aminoimidazole carboxamide ribotide isomerase
MRIIPAIDILGGKCVRLVKGDYSKSKIYSSDPADVAKMFEDNGLKYLHVVDLDGAREKHLVNHKIVEKIAGSTGLTIDLGGGIKSDEDIRIAFECGVKQVTAGTVASTDRDLFISWLKKYGAGAIMLGADALDGKVMIAGWTENTEQPVKEYIEMYLKKGVEYVICTDISRDGMLGGPSTGLYRKLLELSGIRLIASGGISSVADITEVKEAGCEGVIVGKAIYEGRITLKELSLLC